MNLFKHNLNSSAYRWTSNSMIFFVPTFFFFCVSQRGLNQLQHHGVGGHSDSGHPNKERGVPVTVQGLRTNPKDGESHAILFDAEALIGKHLNTTKLEYRYDLLKFMGLSDSSTEIV